MGECCSLEGEIKPSNTKRECPICGDKSLSVPLKTILHHINRAWDFKFKDQRFYYCRNAKCDVVYFSTADFIIVKSDIRTAIGIKEQSDDALICFCFGVSKIDAATDKNAKDFVIRQTKTSMCSCQTANPSGRCCLKDFPK